MWEYVVVAVAGGVVISVGVLIQDEYLKSVAVTETEKECHCHLDFEHDSDSDLDQGFVSDSDCGHDSENSAIPRPCEHDCAVSSGSFGRSSSNRCRIERVFRQYGFVDAC